MSDHTVFGIGIGKVIVDLPSADWMFHLWSDRSIWGIDRQGRFPLVHIVEETNHSIAVKWPLMDDVPEDVRWLIK